MNHGVNTSQQATSVAVPASVASGIPFIVGTAKYSDAPAATRATVNVPLIATTWDEAEAALGYSDSDWNKYTLYEAMYAYFKLFGVGPVIFCPVGEDATADTAQAAVIAGIEQIELCGNMFGLVPDLILAPGFAGVAAVQAVMMTKAAAINDKYQARAVLDIEAATYSAAITAKTSGSFNERGILAFGHPKSGDFAFHGSTYLAARIAQTDGDNEGIPYESPSNKYVPMDSLVNNSGTALQLSETQANLLNAQGIVTFINVGGQFVAWGNYTAAYPTSSDVAEIFIPVARMFDYVRKVITQTFRDKVDDPLDTRLHDTINDSVNIWLNGLVGSGYLMGGRCEYIADENPTTSLMGGTIKFHVYITPPGPAQEIDFVVEYDVSYLEAAFSE